MIDWTYKEYNFAIYGKSPQNTSDRGMAGKIALAIIRNLGEDTPNNHEEITPTGYPSDEIQRQQVMYNGVLYYYTANGFDNPLPDGYEFVGEVKEVDNKQEPTADWCGSRVDIGQKIYASDNTSVIYLEYERGYAAFDAVETEPEVKTDYGASSIYTKEEMDAAIELIKKKFNTWDGCELHSISYSTDDECSESNIAWMNEMEKANDAEETFTQCIMFKSSFHSPLKGGGGFNADEEYTDWQWWLARSEGGQWKLMTWGY